MRKRQIEEELDKQTEGTTAGGPAQGESLASKELMEFQHNPTNRENTQKKSDR